jgi:hypothetical protein
MLQNATLELFLPAKMASVPLKTCVALCQPRPTFCKNYLYTVIRFT